MMIKKLHFRVLVIFAVMALVACTNEPHFRQQSRLVDLNAVFSPSETKLIIAARNGDLTQIKHLVYQGNLINAFGPQGSSFSIATKAGYSEVALYLLKSGAKYDLGFSPDEASALVYAAQIGANDLLKALIVKNMAVNFTDEQGYSAVARAAINGHLSTLKILINAGADVNVAPEGRSLLMHLVEKNSMLLSQVLIASSVDVNFRSEAGDTALSLARKLELEDLSLMLVQAGAISSPPVWIPDE